MIPLVPPVSVAVAEVGDDDNISLSMSKDMMQPDAAGHLICASPVIALPATLKNIRSLFVLVLLNSVIGEQATLAVVSVGPKLGALITPAVIDISYIAFTDPLVPHTYKSPVALLEL
jgi:hypothetical protein